MKKHDTPHELSTAPAEPHVPAREGLDSAWNRVVGRRAFPEGRGRDRGGCAGAIANTAGFHFAYIEQGGASLYTNLSLKVSSLEVLRIVVSIGGVEVDHFGLWHDKCGNAVAQPLAGVTDPKTGLTFPDLNAPPFGGEQFQTNLILPEPASFIRKNLPPVSVIRPSLTENAGAVATIKSFTADLLFEGQTPQFFRTVMALARAADAAERQVH